MHKDDEGILLASCTTCAFFTHYNICIGTYSEFRQSWSMDLVLLLLGFPYTLNLKGMRRMMFQLSGFYFTCGPKDLPVLRNFICRNPSKIPKKR